MYLAGMPTDELFSVLKKAGYPGRWVTPATAEEQDVQAVKLKSERRHVIFAALLSAPLALGMFPALFGYHQLMLPPLLQLLLASIVQFYFGVK